MADDLKTEINKLLEMTTRIDERIVAIHDTQHQFDERLVDAVKDHNDSMKRIAVLESKQQCCPIHNIDGQLGEIDKRVVLMEDTTNKAQDRWKAVLTFVIQLVWVLLASWLLVKLNLQAPAVP